MQHFDDGSIELLLSGEPSEPEVRRLLDHMAGCEACSRRFEAAKQEEQEIGALLSLVDHPVPKVGVEEVIRRATRLGRRTYIAAAAGIVLFVLAAAASATPGSPLRSWLVGLLGEAREAPAQDGQGPSTGAPGGISVIPAGEFELVFEAVQEVGVLRISLTDENELAIRSIGGGPGYSIAPEHVRVENAGSTADYEITIPRSAEHVRIRVADAVVLVKRGASIVTAAVQDAAGRYVMNFADLPPRNPSE